jgi:nucleoside phosphorylase
MRILVTFALENEFAPWRKMHKFRPGKWGDADVEITKMGCAEVGVLLTGVGPKQARLETSKVAWTDTGVVEICIASGLAGALRPEYRVGQVLVARTVESDTVREGATFKVMQSTRSLISMAAECGATVVGRFHTSERVVVRSEDKQRLGAAADAVEMESFDTIFSVGSAGCVFAVAVRAVSDVVDEDLPLNLNEVFTDEGRLSVPRVLGQLAHHPQAIPGLVKLREQGKRAAESLATFLERYILFMIGRMDHLAVKLSMATR